MQPPAAHASALECTPRDIPEYQSPGTSRNSLPKIVKADVGFHQLGPVGKPLRKVPEQQILERLALSLWAHQHGLAADSQRLCRVVNRRLEVTQLVNKF